LKTIVAAEALMGAHSIHKEDSSAGIKSRPAIQKLPFAAHDGDSPRDRLMAAARELICRDGITATGIDKIVERACTAKTTLYKVFGSKDALVEAVLEAEGLAWRDWFIQRLKAHQSKPATKLAGVFEILEIWFHSERFYGCPFINAVGEGRKNDDRMRDIAIKHKKIVLTELEGLARKAGASNPSRLTHELALLMDGAIVTAMITKDPSVARTAGHAAKIVIDNAIDAENALAQA